MTVQMGELLLLFISVCDILHCLGVITDLQAVAVTVVLDKQITIGSIYFPPHAAFC